MVEIDIEEIPVSELKPKFKTEDNLGFGRLFTDRMFFMEYINGEWKTPKIKKFGSFKLSPAAVVLHYGQEIFEGMKAYPTADGHLNLFRPDKNAERFNKSAERIMMPPIESDVFLTGLKKLLELEKDWAPKSDGTSLYIRPTMIGVTPQLGVQPSREYYFYIILAPSGPYFPEGFNPIKIFVSEYYIRAATGGTGMVKTGGNYAGSLLVGKEATDRGCSQVLWLDAVHKKYIEEVGAMNIFVYMDNVIYTAPLTSETILPGVTRESTIQLARDLGYTVKEKALNIDDVIEGIHNGDVHEIFGSGTAASIAPVGSLVYKDEEHIVNNFQVGEVSKKLYKTLTEIQCSRVEDKYGWVVRAC
ncbi:MAG: branched-chain amino acid aminotransferase [Candidatus Hodarchaeales archaeon]|jgi:branched-chain amino acid aminotransferase